MARRLGRERAELIQLDAREERSRELASVGASPSAMVAAALIFGTMLGFGAALFDEVRRPRVADVLEAERASGVRVLGVIRPLPPSAERRRRSTDRTGPAFLDSGADGHQLVYLTVAATGSNLILLTVTGDSPAVSAVIAMNFAAIASAEARATLLIDADGATATVSSALHLGANPGLRELAAGSAQWPEVTRSARLGRDRVIDVVTSGRGTASLEETKTLFQRDGTRLSRHYDAVVVVSAADQVAGGLSTALPVSDVLFCARQGRTPIAELKQAIEAIKSSGARIRGIVLWNAVDPVFSASRPAEVVARGAASAA